MSCTGEFCNGCVQQELGVRRLEPEGSGRNGVLIVGDSPYITEIAEGRPFAGPSGKFLDSILAKRGHDRADFAITNVMSCRPPHLGWTDYPERYENVLKAQAQCSGYLLRAIEHYRPRVMLALGNVALRALTKLDGIEDNHGYCNSGNYGIPVVATFHPSFLIQSNHKFTLPFVLALERALEIARGEYRETKDRLIEDPSLAQLDDYLNPQRFIIHKQPFNPKVTIDVGNGPDELMCDIETPDSPNRNEETREDDASYTIIRMGFSNSVGSGISFPFEGGYVARARDAVKRAKVVLFWHKDYDLPRLRNAAYSH